MLALAGVVVVLICNTNRGGAIVIRVCRGSPWWSWRSWSPGRFLLGRTRYGRYIYAIGGNPEAARRAGMNLAGSGSSGSPWPG